ncbi:MAG: hypothetical protein ACQEWV_11010 [Bacillota bacterium]
MVYIKNEANPSIYKHPSEIKLTSNQDSIRRNYLQEFITQQGEMNSTLKNASIEVNMLVNETKYEQQQHFKHVLLQLEHQKSRTIPLIENMNKQEETYKNLLQRFEAIDEFNHELIKKYENEGLVNQAIVDQLTIQDTAIQRLSKNIEQFDGLHKSLSEKIDDQNTINDDILKTLELQESFHKTILERLDHQEALNQKLSRDLESLKATLFERISYVVEKIEDNYKQITGFVTQLFTKSGFIQKITIEKDKKQKETMNSK